jgi:hypothetical protein
MVFPLSLSEQQSDFVMKNILSIALLVVSVESFAGQSRLAEAVNLTPSKANIIIVVPDAVGYSDYACFGNPIMRTPSVDTFKKQRLLFTQLQVSPTNNPFQERYYQQFGDSPTPEVITRMDPLLLIGERPMIKPPKPNSRSGK